MRDRATCIGTVVSVTSVKASVLRVYGRLNRARPRARALTAPALAPARALPRAACVRRRGSGARGSPGRRPGGELARAAGRRAAERRGARGGHGGERASRMRRPAPTGLRAAASARYVSTGAGVTGRAQAGRTTAAAASRSRATSRRAPAAEGADAELSRIGDRRAGRTAGPTDLGGAEARSRPARPAARRRAPRTALTAQQNGGEHAASRPTLPHRTRPSSAEARAQPPPSHAALRPPRPGLRPRTVASLTRPLGPASTT